MTDPLRKAWRVLHTAVAAWIEHDGPLASAATAYYAVFSIFPAAMVVIAVVGALTRYSPAWLDARRELADLINRTTTPWLASQIALVFDQVEDQAALGGPLGLVVLVFGVLAVFTQLSATFARIWHQHPPPVRTWVDSLRLLAWQRLIAFAAFLGIGALLGVLFILHLVLRAVQHYWPEAPLGWYGWSVTHWLLSLTLVALLLALTYKIVPPEHVPWRQALAGGLIAAIAWHVGQQAVAWLLVADKYSAYGVVGVVIAILAWLYYASAAVFLGAEFVRALARERSVRDTE